MALMAIGRYQTPITVLALLLAFQLIHFLYSDLAYIRLFIEEGEVWRMLTGHLVHNNIYHLLSNAAMVLLLSQLEQHSAMYRLIELLAISLLISLGFYVYYPDLQYYVGFSGVIHGYIVILLFGHASSSFKIAFWGAMILVVKLLIEQLGLYPNGNTERLIGVRVATEAHLMGAVFGVFLCAFETLLKAMSVVFKEPQRLQ